MGAALRAGTRQLQVRPEKRRLMLLLTDGKPHDLDGYDGRAGLEDTREAVREARRAGLLPFALTIADDAAAVMPLLFGGAPGTAGGGWARVQRPDELPRRLAGLVAQLRR
jgi:nitric oxide reductase NorD protein